MKKFLALALLIPLVGCATAAPYAPRAGASADQSLISGQLVASDLENKYFIFSSPLMDFAEKTLTMKLLPDGKLKSKDTNVSRWDVGPDNTLRFYMDDELRAKFTYDSRRRALIAKPFIRGKQAYIKLWVAADQY